ncbi:MAG: TRAP transporter fused permease subunit [Sulfurospirillaceae bacterium]|nr:TRAP transporter fused permease subunit [Sulfurospirillaceae bacterium]MDD2826547.1 TRAP transporter fused permease subunit [Sulfurospirillaceae bacterium]
MTISKQALKPVLFWYAVFISLFHVWINVIGGMSNLWFNASHFSLLGSLGFLTYKASSASKNDDVHLLDIILSLVTLSIAGYMIGYEESLYAVANGNMRQSDIIYATLAILLAVEMLRRTTGWIIPILIMVSVSYVTWMGNYISGVLAFGGMSYERFSYRMFYTDEGLFGSIATISSTYVFMFILFAAFLLKSGAGDFIVDLSRAFTNRFRGGAAQVAVFSSALMGTISGSAVANVVSTGSITIPMMKRNGFSGIFAAAVETAASTGGQIVPPIMGAGAFVMAQITNIPYTTIVLVSILPAILYYVSISVYVHIYAKEHNIGSDGEIIAIWPIIREGMHFFIPIGVLVGLMVYGYTPTYAAGYSILAIIAASYLTKTKRMSFQQIVEAFAMGAQNMITTGVMMIAVGIIVGVINISGIGVTFSQLIMEWSANQLIIAMILVALASLVLGMGLPVTASYVVLAVLSAPALVGLMVSPEMAALLNAGVQIPEVTMYFLAAHLIIFWLSQDSNLTPPVCLAAFAAAGIAESSPMKTGFMSWKLGKGLYIMPFLFAYSPLITGSWYDRFEVFGFALIGLIAFAATVEGYWDRKLPLLERALFGISCYLLLSRDKMLGLGDDIFKGETQLVHLLGLTLFIIMMFYHKQSTKKHLRLAQVSS